MSATQARSSSQPTSLIDTQEIISNQIDKILNDLKDVLPRLREDQEVGTSCNESMPPGVSPASDTDKLNLFKKLILSMGPVFTEAEVDDCLRDISQIFITDEAGPNFQLLRSTMQTIDQVNEAERLEIIKQFVMFLRGDDFTTQLLMVMFAAIPGSYEKFINTEQQWKKYRQA